MSAIQTVNFIPPGSFVAIQNNIAALQTGTTDLQTDVSDINTTISNPETYFDQIGAQNLFNSMNYDYKMPAIDCWEIIKVYENLKNCMTGPTANTKQRAFADDEPTNLYTPFMSATNQSIQYKTIKMTEVGLSGLAKQLLATGKIVHMLIFHDGCRIPAFFWPAQYQISKQVDASDETNLINNCTEIANTMTEYCTELINGVYGPVDSTLQNYLYTLRLWFQSDSTAYSNEGDIQFGPYATYVNTLSKYHMQSETLAGQQYPVIPLPFALNLINIGGPFDPKLSVTASQNMPNVYLSWYNIYNQWLQAIKTKRESLPELGAPLSVWGATAIDPVYGGDSNNISTIIQQKEAVPNGDGMGNTLPTGTFASFGDKFSSFPYAGVVLNMICTGTFEDYSYNNPLWGYPDSEFLIPSLSDKLSTSQKQKIYDDCKYVFENVCQPLADEIVRENETIYLTNGKQFYDRDLWTNRWRYLIPGEILYCTGPSGPVEGTYNACVVNMTGVSDESLATIINDGASYTNESEKIVLVPFSHPNIDIMVQKYKKFMQIVNCVFDNNTYISTYEITGAFNYNTYPSYSSILDNYNVNVFTATGVDDFIDGVIANGESSNQFCFDLKYKLANDWIAYDYAVSGAGGLFGGATGLDSYEPSLSLTDKYNQVISDSLADQVMLDGIISDLDYFGYNYGYIPPGITGAAGDVAPVYVATGFSAPTFGTLSSQRANNGYTTQIRESLNTVYNLDIPMYFIYRQHYKIHNTGAAGISAGTPLNASNNPTNNFRTEYSTSNIYNSLRRSLATTTRTTYLGAKESSVMEKHALASWNQAMTQQDIYNTGFINNYLLTSTGSSKYAKFRAVENNDSNAYTAAGVLADPLNPAGNVILLGFFGNASPYSASDYNFNANMQVFSHEVAFGHGVQNLLNWYQSTNNAVVSPWTTLGQSADINWGNIPGVGVNGAVNFEGWATFGEFLAFCQGYQYSYDLATNSIVSGINNNYPGYILSMNASNRIPARQVCDPKFNLPKYGWSASKLINSFVDITGLPLSSTQDYMARFMGSEAQQTTYNFGFCVNLAARNILIGLLGDNYDPTKYTQFRIEQTSYFVSTDILDYVTENYLDFSK